MTDKIALRMRTYIRYKLVYVWFDILHAYYNLIFLIYFVNLYLTIWLPRGHSASMDREINAIVRVSNERSELYLKHATAHDKNRKQESVPLALRDKES